MHACTFPKKHPKNGVIAKVLAVRPCELQNSKSSVSEQEVKRSKSGDLVLAMVREEQAS